MTTYKFATFNYIDQDIILPAETIFYRGIDSPIRLKKDDIIRNYPMYIGPKDIAEHYGTVYQLRANKHLKLLDIRKLKTLLKLIITSRKSNDGAVLQSIRYLTIAFGLCSYVGQINLLDQYLLDISGLVIDKDQLEDVKNKIEIMKKTNPTSILNPLEPEGVRIAETTIDGKVMLILRELFKGIYDGYIAPKTWSSFHVGNYTHEEIVIFDPIKSEIDMDDTKTVKTQFLSKLLDHNYKSYDLKDNFYEMKIYGKVKIGGQVYEDKNKFFDDKKEVKKAEREAKLFMKNVNIKNIKYKKP